MKTTFRRRFSSPASADGRRALYALVILGGGLLLFYFFRSETISMARPLWIADNAVARKLGDFAGFFRAKASLIEENRMLKERLASLEALSASYRTLLNSHAEFLSEFGRADRSAAIPAGVLAHPPETPFDSLVIDAGGEDGVAVGARVSLPEDGALGIVKEVFGRQARVELYTGSGVTIGAVLERHSVPVVLVGIGGGGFEFSLPRETEVLEGDKLLLRGLKAELVGVVEEVELRATDSEKRVLARGVANIQGLRFVSVEK